MEAQKRHTYQSGIIGNCSYIAHIAKDSNICWLCWPTFQDSFIFGGLLDTQKGGEFSIKPTTTLAYLDIAVKKTPDINCLRRLIKQVDIFLQEE